jgi:hypothetical protein
VERDPRLDALFEAVKIGPVTAPNRFYQVPHCTGMGYHRPRMLTALRGVKAEGGWGVVCTEYCSIHTSSDESPQASASLRDDDDVSNLRLVTDAIHAQGALAGVERVSARGLVGFEPGSVRLECVYSARPAQLDADQLVPITARQADDGLWLALDTRRDELNANGLLSLQRIGDCRAPGMIAAAVYAGHKAARELGCQQVDFKRDRVVV